MNNPRISELTPELPELETKRFKASVILIWPYSSSQRQFALLLAEQDIRLRRKQGQVRARFSGSSAKAIATTGIGIGDELVLGLRGAHFVKEGAIRTPGKSIDWELEYTQTVEAHVIRNGNEIARLELVDIAPTPLLRSPSNRKSVSGPSPSQEWSSPAVLKRIRLSDGSLLTAPYDPFIEVDSQVHDRKRRRKSYRDWKAWTYSARTPSPEKEDAVDELETLEYEQISPIQVQHLPTTPVSPATLDGTEISGAPCHESKDEEKQHSVSVEESSLPVTDMVDIAIGCSGQYHESYTNSNNVLPEQNQYVSGSGTEKDTYSINEADAAQNIPENTKTNIAVTNERENCDDPLDHGQDITPEHYITSSSDVAIASTERITNDFTEKLFESLSSDQATALKIAAQASEHNVHRPPATERTTETPSATLRIDMPPPSLPTLQTEEVASIVSTLLTPVGNEPSSPILKPLDSSTLPLPSPFPGEIDTNMALQQEYFASDQENIVLRPTVHEELKLPSDTDYIMDTSFYSSIGSSRTPVIHPSHESAFTPVRFTFGLDGAGWSRPLGLSSHAPDNSEVQETLQMDVEQSIVSQEKSIVIADHKVPSYPRSYTVDEEEEQDVVIGPINIIDSHRPSVIHISPSSQHEESETEDALEATTIESRLQFADEESYRGKDGDEKARMSTEITGTVSTIIDLGSPSSDDTEESDHELSRSFIELDEFHHQQDGRSKRSSLGLDNPLGIQSPDKDAEKKATHSENYNEFVDFDYAPRVSGTIATKQRTNVHDMPLQEVGNFDTSYSQSHLLWDETPSQGSRNESSYRMQNVSLFEGLSEFTEPEMQNAELHFPDVKVESIEDDSIFEQLMQLTGVDRSQTPETPKEELIIAVPEAGGKMGQLQTMAVPATGPALNTRSKLSVTVSPNREREYTPRKATRSIRSNASVTRDTLSPVETRSRAAFSTPHGTSQVSPYGLRSQTKLLSPRKGTAESLANASRSSSPKQTLRKAISSQADAVPSPINNHPVDMGLLGASYDPSASQGRFSNITYVKDSEEDSVRSEHSISTVYLKDGSVGIHSDPVQPTGLLEDLQQFRPPPASAPEPNVTSQARQAFRGVTRQVLRSSSPAQPIDTFDEQFIVDSPSKRLLSASSATASAATESGRQTRRPVHIDRSTEPVGQSDELEDQPTPRTAQDLADEFDQRENTPIGRVLKEHDPIDLHELMRSSPPQSIVSTVKKTSALTPEAIQQSTMHSQSSFTGLYHTNDLPMTPDPTQATSTGLTSFDTEQTNDLSKTVDEASSDVSSDPAESMPSIGLSTPLAYYTPLRDLVFFLNRSSQYRSTDAPDTLALITSNSTPSTRAKKGPRHYFTTLHITDLSSFPRTTTVSVFRPYEKALPVAHKGDVVLLRAFAVKSANRQPSLISTEESAWCVWRWGKPCWDKKQGAFGELRAREEVRGPDAERGEGEWREVERLREWYLDVVKEEMADGKGGVEVDIGESSQVATASQGHDGSVGDG